MSVGFASFCMSLDGFIVGPNAGPDDALEIDATDASPLRPSVAIRRLVARRSLRSGPRRIVVGAYPGGGS